MPVDYARFPFPSVSAPHAASLTEAITVEALSEGYAVVTVKSGTAGDLTPLVRDFAKALRAKGTDFGLHDITAYREIRAGELGGTVPFDQEICARMLNDAKERLAADPDRWPRTKWAIKMMERNDFADWTLLVEFATVGHAERAVAGWNGGCEDFARLTRDSASHTAGAFANTKGYARVSRDPAAIQFFNFFPGPGDRDVLWAAWQAALPWFLEIGEFRSSFPLVARDPDQALLVVNFAHLDSLKHYFLGVAYDPNFFETVSRCYLDRGFKAPEPFFCKIVPV